MSFKKIIFLIVTTILVFVFGPRVESFLFPVVPQFDITKVFFLNGELFIEGFMDKARDCIPKDVSLWTRGNELVLNPLTVEFRPDQFHTGDSSNELRTRPEALQLWGPWKIDVPDDPTDNLIIIARHSCHSLWEIQAVIFQEQISNITDKLNFRVPQL